MRAAIRVDAAACSLLQAVPVLLVSRDDIEWFGLDAAALSLVNAIDGLRTVARVVAATGLDAEDAVARMQHLLAERIVTLTL